MESVCLSSAYLAPVEYYTVLAAAGNVWIEQFDSYEKQTYRNRCHIATSNGIMSLTIPVEKKSGEKVLMRDVRISEHNDWQMHHWRSIEAAYNSSPFFEYYADDIRPFYEQKWEFLLDFNMQLQYTVSGLLDIQPELHLTTAFGETEGNAEDMRNRFHPKRNENNVLSIPYYQVFEQRFGFIPGLSIIDLLFNMGNESQLILIQQKM